MRHTFKAYERLKREQHIDTLFRTGKAFSVFPIKFIYLPVPRSAEERSPVRAVFSTPKKRFRKAVDRNRVRRLMKEAWRLNKQPLYDAIPADAQLHIFLIFTDSAIPDYNTVLQAIARGIDRLIKTITNPGNE